MKLRVALLFLCISTFLHAEECSQLTLPDVNEHDLILFGELHGTNEIPELFGQLVCNAVNSKEEGVTVLLELPDSMDSSFQKFVSETITSPEFLRQGGWDVTYQDGRYSDAMFKLLAHLKNLKLSHGEKLSINFIDEPFDPNVSRSDLLAKNIKKHSKPNYQTLVLIGNYHNQLTLGEDSLVAKLSSYDPLSLSISWKEGEQWACTGPSPVDDCGIVTLKEGTIEKHLHFNRLTSTPKRWHALLEVERLTASPPAVMQ